MMLDWLNHFYQYKLSDYAEFIGILLGTFIIAYIFSRVFKRFILKSTVIIKNDPTNYQFLRHFLTALIYIIGISLAIYSVPSMRTIANSMLAGAGILAVAIGFASQQTLSNIISGIFIVIFKPFRVNDRLRIRDNLNGIVEDITLRHTVIRDFENRRIIVPNNLMGNEIIINSDFEDDRICNWIEIQLEHGTNIPNAKIILAEISMNHPFALDNRSEVEVDQNLPMVKVKIIQINPIGVTIRAWIWTTNSAKGFELKCDLNDSIYKKFQEEGISFSKIAPAISPSKDNMKDNII
jgi:small-conductance mechanosensitive channel